LTVHKTRLVPGLVILTSHTGFELVTLQQTDDLLREWALNHILTLGEVDVVGSALCTVDLHRGSGLAFLDIN